MGQVKVARIRELNDAFRKSLRDGPTVPGRIMVTAGIDANGPDFVLKVLNAVAGFDNFSEANDPHGEHDFGNFEVDGDKIYFKVDYYDANCVYGSEDPTDTTKTTRVLTIMLAEEY